VPWPYCVLLLVSTVASVDELHEWSLPSSLNSSHAIPEFHHSPSVPVYPALPALPTLDISRVYRLLLLHKSPPSLPSPHLRGPPDSPPVLPSSCRVASSYRSQRRFQTRGPCNLILVVVLTLFEDKHRGLCGLRRSCFFASSDGVFDFEPFPKD
jgi:hypothetical protein